MKIAGKNNNNMAGNKTIVLAIVALAIVVALIVVLVVILPNATNDKNGPVISSSSTTKSPDKIEGISIDTASTKTLYYVGQELDLSQIKIFVSTNNKADDYYVYGNDPDVKIYGFDSTLVNENLAIDVEYKGKTTSFTVSVLPMPEEIQGTVTGFTILTTPKSVYDLGEGLDLTQIILSVTVEERTEPYIVNAAYPDFEVSGFDSSKVDDETHELAIEITITYKENPELTQSYSVTIRDKANYEVVILGLNIVTKPKTSYNVGEEFDRTGMVIQVETQDYTSDYFLDGNDPAIQISDFNSSVPAANQIVTISYKGVSTKLTVTIKDNTPAPELTAVTIKGLKTTYTVEKWNTNKLNISGAYWEYEYGNDSENVVTAPVLSSHVPSLSRVEGPCEFELVLTDSNGVKVTVTITITE